MLTSRMHRWSVLGGKYKKIVCLTMPDTICCISYIIIILIWTWLWNSINDHSPNIISG